jgi:NAD(P)-dependent dehydrogenase (short-subunit alcohol dehydrogenase family)
VAVVTGAGDGIGRAVATAYAAEGARLVVADIDESSVASLAAELSQAGTEVEALRADVAEKDEVVAMVAAAVTRFGTVDVLVNNAWGGGSLSRLERKSDEQMAHGMAVGFYGPFWAMQAAFGPMQAQGRGNIVNLCSLNGVNAHVGTAEYNAAKEALRALTRTAAREWAEWGIVVNALCPGAKTAAFRRLASTDPGLVAMADQANPMGRLGDPLSDIAPVAVFLASDDARYLTGNTLFVDGGAHINGVAWAPSLPDPPGVAG